MEWTDKRKARLEKLWSDGVRTEEVRKAFLADDPYVTRNMIIGKVHGMRLHIKYPRSKPAGKGREPHERTSRVAVSPPQTRKNKKKVVVAPRAASAAPEKNHIDHFALDDRPVKNRIKVVELNESTCRWPMGDPLSQHSSFCGAPAKKRSPYCEFHSETAYRPIEKKPQTVNPPRRRYSPRV